MITENIKQELKRYARHLSFVEDITVSEIPAAWVEILHAGSPDILRAFYTGLHNGWTCAVSQALGLKPLEDIQYLDAFEWGILESINVKKLGISLDKAYSVLSNAGPGYLCLQNDGGHFKSFIWWTNQAPKLDVDFWPVLDAWTEIGLTN